jgi:hypothetical protein
MAPSPVVVLLRFAGPLGGATVFPVARRAEAAPACFIGNLIPVGFLPPGGIAGLLQLILGAGQWPSGVVRHLQFSPSLREHTFLEA